MEINVEEITKTEDVDKKKEQAGAELCQAQFQLIVSLITRLYTSKHLYDEDQRVDRDCKSAIVSEKKKKRKR